MDERRAALWKQIPETERSIMTKEIRTEKEIREVDIERSYTETKVDEVEVEVEGVRCDFCTQWYEDGEVEFREMVEEPEVRLNMGTQPMSLYQLLENLKISQIFNPQRAGMVGSNETFIVGHQSKEVNKLVGLRDALMEYVEARGGPSEDPLREENLRASTAHGRRAHIEDGDIVFDLDVDPEIAGETWHMCEYCVEARE